MLVQASRIVISYRDEGVLDFKKPSSDGIAVFDFTGQQVFGFNETQPYFLLDCYALCKSGNHSILAYTYTDLPLLEITSVNTKLFNSLLPPTSNAHKL